jgi:hypothetical protein
LKAKPGKLNHFKSALLPRLPTVGEFVPGYDPSRPTRFARRSVPRRDQAAH